MIGHAAGLSRLDGIIWAIIAAVAGIMLIAPFASNFQLVGHSFLAAGGATALSLAGYWLYQTRRPDPRLASALGGTAQIVAFAAVGAPVSYIAASLDLPLRDAWFDAVDHALGLDWSALLGWMDAHATLHPLFRLIYFSLMPQTVVVVLALALAGRLAWMRVFVLAFMISTVVTIVVAAIVPAEGVWGFHKLSAAAYPDIIPATREIHLPTFLGLRDGSFRQLMAMGAQGIITFPSLHAALALIITVGLWPIPVLRWIGLAINALMLVSIPIDGGHYFIDVPAGLAIAWASIAAAKRIAELAHQPRLQTARAEVGLAPGN
jgi:membrane-associated phospholipid phosphatase